jgi:4-amino-4-deoxy-L-arabinose transferase-like glycosyltransferase
LLILIATAMRLGFGWALGLGVDESYMVAAGRTLNLGYFDHPPASWWLAWGAAHLLGSEAPVVVRLPFILLFALSS